MPSSPTATGPSPDWSSPALREMKPKDQPLVVALRIRPLSDTEQDEGATVIAHKVGDQMVVLMDPGEDPEDTLRAHRSREKTFIFDTVFDQHVSQEDVYRATTQHLVEGVVSGYNATVFAYGPSGAGKTYTMLGVDTEPGVYLRALSDLFRAIETRGSANCSVSVSYLEIYNEVIRDLLNPSSGCLELREDSRGSVQIPGIMEVSTSNVQEITQLLTKGNRQRTQEPTAANKTSSRSHAVLQVTVRQWSCGPHLAEEVSVGKLFMVDLAGSERASQTQNRGRRMKEGSHINRSLLALGNCINALSEKGGSRAQYVNFRDSKLTRLLKDALGGNSWTVMVAHISPASTHFEESRSTLLYACRARNIKTRVKRNLLSVSYHIQQHTDGISSLHREIQHLKSKIEKQEEEKRGEPGVRDAPVKITAHDGEGSRRQMNKVRAQLIGAFKEQLKMRRSLVELENTNMQLHIDLSRHLLTIADWEWEKTQHLAHGAQMAERNEPAEANEDGHESESEEPHEVALAREEVSLLLAEQRRAAALKAGLEQRLASAKEQALQLEELLPAWAHELDVGNTELQGDSVCRQSLLRQKDPVARRHHQHRLLCEQLPRDQWQRIKGGGLVEPRSRDKRCHLPLGELNCLRLLNSVTSNSLRDGSVLSKSPALPEEASRDWPDDRQDPPWGAQLELPTMLLEADSGGHNSSQATPSKTLAKQDLLLPPPPLCTLLTPPAHEHLSPWSVKNSVSKPGAPAGLDLGASRTAAEVGGLALSARALEEMAVSTRGIALIAATRRSKVQDPESRSSRSSLHLPEDVALDSRAPSPADRWWLHSGMGRDHSAERKARRTWSPSLIGSVRSVTENLQPLSVEHVAESQPPPVSLPLTKPSGKSFLPAICTASKKKASPSLHADEKTLQVPEVSLTLPSAPWQSSPGPRRTPLAPQDIQEAMLAWWLLSGMASTDLDCEQSHTTLVLSSKTTSACYL
ncbi:kinesin-like protein KIF19 [Suricata suricatta]|uniref:kinesin-like protein KIF19 n=1 Tax=Suricata suricatta TaxID=37032 RepID=UPI001155D899|nr:kinesin-like protein KIF19 [Suricata suricatta]